MGRYLAYDPRRLVALKGATDASIWHVAAARFDHAYCEDWRASVLAIRPRLEELRDTLLQPVIESAAMSASIAATLPACIVVNGEVLDTPEEIREYFESRADDGDTDQYGVVIATMMGLTPAQGVAYWATLTEEEKRDFIDKRPDLAVNALVGGAALTSDELEQLESSNAFALFSEEFGVEIGAQLNLRWATISIDASYSVVAMKMSDGTVQVAIVSNHEAGIGVEADGGEGASVSMTAGAFISSGTVFLFPDEESAEEAIDHLQNEVGNHDGWDTAADAADVAAGPFWDDDNDFETFVKNTWDQYGMMRRDEGGVYANVAAGVESDLVEAGVEAEIRISLYDTDTTDLASQRARTGIMVVGTVGAHAETSSGTGGSASAGGDFTVDAYTDSEGGEFVTLTVTGSASTGVVSELVDYAGVDADVQAEGGGRVSVTVTVPLNAENVSGVVSSLATGQIPGELADLYDAADITVTIDATAEVTTEVEVDAVVVEASVTHTQTDTVNVVTLHKYPDGEFYSQNGLDAQVEAEQWDQNFNPSAPIPYDPEALLYDENGTAVAIDSGGTFEYLDGGSSTAPPQPTFLEQIAAPASPAVEIDPSIPVMSDPNPHYLYNVDGEPVAIDAGTAILPLPDDQSDAT